MTIYCGGDGAMFENVPIVGAFNFSILLEKTDQLAQILIIKLGEGNMTEAFRQQQLAKICVITQCSESR